MFYRLNPAGSVIGRNVNDEIITVGIVSGVIGIPQCVFYQDGFACKVRKGGRNKVGGTIINVAVALI